MWRVVRWVRTDDQRWAVGAVSEHPDGDISDAFEVARDWIRCATDDIEHGRVRVLTQHVSTREGRI